MWATAWKPSSLPLKMATNSCGLDVARLSEAGLKVVIDTRGILGENTGRLNQVKTGTELVSATKRFAKDDPRKSWWCVLSSTFLLFAALAGTAWNLPMAVRAGCSVLSGFLLMRLFVIYHRSE